MKIFAIIPAGGRGKRIDTSLPKQFIKINSKEIIYYTLKTFDDSGLIDRIVIPVNKDYKPLLQNIISKYKIKTPVDIVDGGTERQDSVYNALNSIKADDKDIVVVHDAARPLLPLEILISSITEAKKNKAVVVAVKAKDTLMKGEKIVDRYIDRSGIYYVQTPQVFEYGILSVAMKKAMQENFYGTDESMLVKRIGQEIKIVEGSAFNFKVTERADLEILKVLLQK